MMHRKKNVKKEFCKMFLYHKKNLFNLFKRPSCSRTIDLIYFLADSTTDFHYHIHKSLIIIVFTQFSQSNEKFHICILVSHTSIETETLQKARKIRSSAHSLSQISDIFSKEVNKLVHIIYLKVAFCSVSS